MSTKSLGQLTLDMVLKTGSYTEPLDKAARQTKQQLKEIEKSATQSSEIVERSFATLGIGISLNELRKYSDTWTDLNSRVRLAVGPMGDASAVMNELQEIARRTYSSLEGSAEGYLLNAAALNELGYSTQQQLQFTNALAAGLVASGAKQERAASVIDAISKSISEGVLRGDNWNTVYQTGGEVAEALAKGLGLSRQELDKLARSGQLTAEKVVPALIGQLEDLQQKADSMGTTVGDAFVQLDNAALKVFGSLAEGSKASGLTSAAILKLADNLETVVDIAALATAVMIGRLAPSVVATTAAFVSNIAMTMQVNAQLAAMAGVSANTARSLLVLDVASKKLNASLAFLGGPVGLFFAAGAAISYFVLTSDEGADSAEKLTQSLKDMQQPLDNIVAGYRKLSVDQQAAKMLEMTKAQEKAVKDANKEWNNLKETIKDVQTSGFVPGGITGALGDPDREKLISDLVKAKEAGEDLTPILKMAGEAAGIPKGKIERWIEIAGAFSTARIEAENAANVIKELSAPQSIGGKVDVAPLSEEFQKQTAALIKQIELYGKSGEAAKLLYEIQSGALAGKLSETEQKALLALAQKYDLLNENAEAAKRLADEEKKAADTVQAFIENARETSKLLQAQLAGTNNLSQAQQELIKFEAKLAEIRKKETLTALDKEYLAQEAITRAQLEKNAALEDEVTQRQDALRLMEFMGNLQLETGSYQEQYQIQLGLLGLSERQRQMDSERLEINRDITRQKQESLRQLQAGDIDNTEYENQIAALEEHLAMRLNLFVQYYEQLEEREGDWTVGALTAMQNYIDNARDIAGQMEDIFGKMFSGLEDSVLEFVKTGEFSMRDLMSSIAEDVIRMLIRIGIQKMATWAIDKIFGAQAAAGYVASITGQASAMSLMAGLNAFASTAAIPIVGPALAPAAMGAALAVSSPLAAGAIAAATGSLAGMAHDGLDYIPNEGTWLLDKGERVLSPRQNEDLTRFLAATNNTNAGSANVKVEVINASGESVKVRNERRGQGVTAEEVIKIFVGDMSERGPMHRSITQTTTAGNRI